MSFIKENFMLQNETAVKLYHTVAKDLPIIDYHCHLSPQEIVEDHVFEDITELWLAGDHYKWRAMRANGVPESHITGDASSKEKFKAWAETAEVSVGNPLFHWTHLEMKEYFGIEELLTKNNWETLYEEMNRQLKENKLTARELIKRSNVEFIGTTDTPFDSLDEHKQIAEDETFDVTVAPSFRPDELYKLTPIDLKRLEELTGKTADTYEALRTIIEDRVDYFDQRGALISDHGIQYVVYAEATDEEIERIFQKLKGEETLSLDESDKWITRLLVDLSKMYADRNWIMQIHFGAIRSTNTRLSSQLGPNIGVDSIADQSYLAEKLNQLLDAMDKEGHLPKTIVYNLNPEYNHIVASATANFQANNEGVKGKVQFGAGWWFNDTEKGMLRQMETLADHGLLNHFVGMLTDSRSFVSYPRHDYFRRIFCNYVGEEVEQGKFPNSEPMLKQLVENVCYYNAKRYFTK
ncbi:glucuronate isomerase [Alkalibacterium sp. MB6]|uniref:glucuronate isomerase n=1 Tax=Alkalibacterium sp. MB6 TaxID=2081965 RepID=UPI00137A231D|nr:glucuronate isomerase [Alkalibacterium sp. MB6]